MSVIELSKPGQEATTYELLITVANAALTFSGIVATQLLFPLKATDCTEQPCPENSVYISGGDAGILRCSLTSHYLLHPPIHLSVSPAMPLTSFNCYIVSSSHVLTCASKDSRTPTALRDTPTTACVSSASLSLPSSSLHRCSRTTKHNVMSGGKREKPRV